MYIFTWEVTHVYVACNYVYFAVSKLKQTNTKKYLPSLLVFQLYEPWKRQDYELECCTEGTNGWHSLQDKIIISSLIYTVPTAFDHRGKMKMYINSVELGFLKPLDNLYQNHFAWICFTRSSSAILSLISQTQFHFPGRFKQTKFHCGLLPSIKFHNKLLLFGINQTMYHVL